jgi:hypothetical protein
VVMLVWAAWLDAHREAGGRGEEEFGNRKR